VSCVETGLLYEKCLMPLFIENVMSCTSSRVITGSGQTRCENNKQLDRSNNCPSLQFSPSTHKDIFIKTILPSLNPSLFHTSLMTVPESHGLCFDPYQINEKSHHQTNGHQCVPRRFGRHSLWYRIVLVSEIRNDLYDRQTLESRVWITTEVWLFFSAFLCFSVIESLQ
jgi:hypothetical protein